MVDYLQDRAEGSILYGFRGGPAGIMKGKYVELTADYIYPYRNQVYFIIIIILHANAYGVVPLNCILVIARRYWLLIGIKCLLDPGAS